MNVRTLTVRPQPHFLAPVVLTALLLGGGATAAPPAPAENACRPWESSLPERGAKEFWKRQHDPFANGPVGVAPDALVQRWPGELRVMDRKRGNKKRKIRLKDELDCDRLADIKVDKGRVLALCRYQQSEDARPGTEGGLLVKGVLISANLKSGRVLWSKDGVFAPGLDAANGRVLVVRDGVLASLDGATGRPIWQAEGIGHTEVGPTVADGHVFVHDEDGGLRAIDLDSGRMLWRAALAGRPFHAPTLGGAMVYVLMLEDGSGKGPTSDPLDKARTTVAAFHAISGVKLWSRQFSMTLPFHRPVATGSALVFALAASRDDQPSVLRVLDGRTGADRWCQVICTDANGTQFTPVLDGDRLLVWSCDAPARQQGKASEAYFLSAFDLGSGRPLWRFGAEEQEKSIYSAPILDGRRLIYSDGEWLRSVEITGGPAGERDQPRRKD